MAHQRRAPRQPGASTRPPVISLDDGMALLTSRLCEELGGVLQLGTAAAQLSRDRRGQLRVTTERGHSLAADAVILACPPGEASRLLRPLAPEAASELGAIDSSSVLHVQLAWPADACPSALKASGYVVAPSAGGALKACTFSSRKWPNRAPSSQITFRCFMRDTELDDAHAVHQAVSSLQSDLQLSAAPSFVHVTRLPAVLPRYRVGHLERVQRIASLLAATPEIQLAGNAYLGPGIPDCIRSAQRAVAPILHALREQCHGHCSARELCGTGTEDSLV
jgi:oxygen-dependent protoporphyrinogen oxidase